MRRPDPNDDGVRLNAALNAVNQHSATVFGNGPYRLPTPADEINNTNVQHAARMLIDDLMFLVTECGWDAAQLMLVAIDELPNRWTREGSAELRRRNER